MNVTVHIIWTIVLMTAILGIYAWAWSPARKEDFAEAANLALHDSNHNPEKEDNNE